MIARTIIRGYNSSRGALRSFIATALVGRKYSNESEADFGYFLALDMCSSFFSAFVIFCAVCALAWAALPVAQGLLGGPPVSQ